MLPCEQRFPCSRSKSRVVPKRRAFGQVECIADAEPRAWTAEIKVCAWMLSPGKSSPFDGSRREQPIACLVQTIQPGSSLRRHQRNAPKSWVSRESPAPLGHPSRAASTESPTLSNVQSPRGRMRGGGLSSWQSGFPEIVSHDELFGTFTCASNTA